MAYIKEYVIILDYWLKLLLSSLIFLPYFEKRKGFWWKLLLVLWAGLVLTGIVALNPPDEHEFIETAVVYFGFTLLINIYLLVCLRADAMTYVFYWFYILFLTGPIDMVRKALEVVGLIQTNTLMYWLVTLLLMAVVYTAGYYLITKRADRYQGLFIQKSMLFLYLMNNLIISIIAFVAFMLISVNRVYSALLFLCAALYHIVSLAVQFMYIMKQYGEVQAVRERAERDTIEQVSHETQKQYELLKNNIEIINLKCHDIRRILQNRSGDSNDYLREAEEAVEIHDCIMKTGNEALDVLLTEAALRCRNHGIQLSCIADGEKLSFMPLSDIYTLFGNLIDNAIEYVSTLPNEERFIRLSVKAANSFLLIHAENYFDGHLELVDGLPRSTKGDDRYHGFGTRSIRKTVEKYGGTVQIRSEDKLFQTDLCIPIPAQAL
jgi:signal transduction histidine kinase